MELAATMSLYGESDMPFEDLIEDAFGAQEFVDMLRDDVLAHMQSLSLEPGFKKRQSIVRHELIGSRWLIFAASN